MKKFPFKVKTFNMNSKKIPIIVIPGFMTADDDEWGRYIARTTKSPVYVIDWSSYNKLDIVKNRTTTTSFSSLISTTAITKILIGLGVVLTAAFARRLYHLWSKACENADIVASILAKEISEHNNNEPFILLGHSLGGRIVSNITDKINNENLMCTITLAGAISKTEFNKITRSKDKIPAMGYINYHSDSDEILKKIYRVANSSDEKPLGLDRSNGYRVIERKYRLGHKDYLNNGQLGIDLREMITRIQYIYDTEIKPS